MEKTKLYFIDSDFLFTGALYRLDCTFMHDWLSNQHCYFHFTTLIGMEVILTTVYYFHFKEWVIDFWLTPTQQFFSYILARTI